MNAAQIFGELIIGLLIADFLTGLGHWWQDRLGNPKTPVIGRHVIRPNRLHHRDPIAFTTSRVVWRSSTTWIAVGTVSLVWFAAIGPSVIWASASIAGMMTNEIHAWAHRPGRVPAIVRTLQRTGIVQSPRHHARHHRDGFDSHYCILTNWLNPVLDALGFWSRMERPLSAIGIRIHRDSDEGRATMRGRLRKDGLL